MPHLEKHSTNNLIDFKRLYSHGTPSPTFLFSPKGKVFNYSTGELFDKILTKKEKSKEMLKQILDYIFTIEDKKVEKLFKKLNKIRKNYNTLEKYAKNASNLEEANKLIVKPKDFWKDGEDEENPFAELFERVTHSKLNIGEMDPEIVEKINQILKDEGILVEDKIEKISKILDEMNDNGEDFVEEEY